MTADFNMELTIVGDTVEIKDMLNVVMHYGKDGDKPAYFGTFMVKSNDYDNVPLSKDIIDEISSAGKIKIIAAGPWGHYGNLNDVGIFREMAEAAPNASFEAEISGFQTYNVQNLTCELIDSKLNIKTFNVANEEVDEAWTKYFSKKLPMKKFIKIFEIRGDDFDKETYEYFLEDFADLCQEGFDWMDYDEFISTIEDNGWETDLDEDRFREIVENELPEMGIQCPLEFEEEYEDKNTHEYVYDPILKKYVGSTKPLFESGQIENADNLIADGLMKLGLPSDKDSVANLSLEEAYEALGASLGLQFKDDEDDSDEWDDEEDED